MNKIVKGKSVDFFIVLLEFNFSIRNKTYTWFRTNFRRHFGNRQLLVRFASYAFSEREQSYHRFGYVESWNLFISCCNSRRFTTIQGKKETRVNRFGANIFWICVVCWSYCSQLPHCYHHFFRASLCSLIPFC